MTDSIEVLMDEPEDYPVDQAKAICGPEWYPHPQA